MRDREHDKWIPWYVDDTPGWLQLSLAARGAAEGIARKLNDKTGTLYLRRGLESLAVLLHVSWSGLEPALRELLSAGKYFWDEQSLTLRDPDFGERMRPVFEAKKSSSAERMARLRWRRRSSDSWVSRDEVTKVTEVTSLASHVTEVTEVTEVTSLASHVTEVTEVTSLASHVTEVTEVTSLSPQVAETTPDMPLPAQSIARLSSGSETDDSLRARVRTRSLDDLEIERREEGDERDSHPPVCLRTLPPLLSDVNLFGEPIAEQTGVRRKQDLRPDEVWDHYVATMKRHRPRRRPTSLTPEDRKRILELLKQGHTVDELKMAVTGLFLSPHHLGQNDQDREYLALDYAIRKKNVASMIARAQDAEPPRRARPDPAEEQVSPERRAEVAAELNALLTSLVEKKTA